MKKRVVALVLVLLMLVPAIASAVTYYRVNTSSLVVRMLPEDDATKLASYSLDTALKYSKKIDSKWSYVEFIGGKEGYVQTKYISKIKSYSAWVTNDDTPIREGVAYNSTEVGRLARGAKVTVLTHGKKYDYVKSSIGYGYVMNGWLSKKKVKASGNASVPAFKPNANYTAYVTNGSRVVNLRAEPSTKSAIIMYYPTGTQVNVISHGADWDYIQVGSNTGYMMTKFLTTAKPAPTDAPVTPTPKPGAYTAYVTSDNGKTASLSTSARAPAPATPSSSRLPTALRSRSSSITTNGTRSSRTAKPAICRTSSSPCPYRAVMPLPPRAWIPLPSPRRLPSSPTRPPLPALKAKR